MSGPKIEIASSEFKHFSGTSKAGKPYDIKLQNAYLHLGDRYPEKCEIPIPKRSDGSFAEPYAPGFYTFAPSSYEVRDGRPAINAFEVKLLPVDEPAQARPRAAGASA